MSAFDGASGEIRQADVFVGTLGASGWTQSLPYQRGVASVPAAIAA